jgi:hypothetical protein
LGVFNGSAALGRLVFPSLENWLLETFTKRGTVLIISAISMHMIPCAMLFRPYRPNDKLQENGVALLDLTSKVQISTNDMGRKSEAEIAEQSSENRFLARIFSHLDFNLLKNPMFLILLASDCLYWLIFFNFVLIMPVTLQEKGFSRQEAAFLLSIPPIPDLITRLCVPIVVDKGWLGCRAAYLGGLSCVLASVLGEYTNLLFIPHYYI